MVLRRRARPWVVSRYLRTLKFIDGLNRSEESGRCIADILKTAIPHLASFQNIQRLEVYRLDLGVALLDALIPIFSSFPGTLRRLLWIQMGDTAHKTWITISAIVNIFPNLADLLLSVSLYPPAAGSPALISPASNYRMTWSGAHRFHRIQILQASSSKSSAFTLRSPTLCRFSKISGTTSSLSI